MGSMNESAEAAETTAELVKTKLESDLEEMVLIHDWLEQFRAKHKFERAAIFQFHNGGKFFQGKSMKKFSAGVGV